MKLYVKPADCDAVDRTELDFERVTDASNVMLSVSVKLSLLMEVSVMEGVLEISEVLERLLVPEVERDIVSVKVMVIVLDSVSERMWLRVVVSVSVHDRSRDDVAERDIERVKVTVRVRDSVVS